VLRLVSYCRHAIAITPADLMKLMRSSFSIVSGLPWEKSARLLQLLFPGLLTVPWRYGLPAHRVA